MISQRLLTLAIALLVLLTGCSLPQVSAEERLFLDLSVDFLDHLELPKLEVEGAPVGGLSAIAYDRQRDRFYAVSDDRSNFAPARFYTLKLNLDTQSESIRLAGVEIERVTPLTDETGTPFPAGSLDPEGIALSPRQTVFISSEGAADDGIAPFIDEFDLETGRRMRRLPIPDRYLPKLADGQPQGVQDNLGFEALTLNPGGFSANGGFLEPFRVFAAPESFLAQDEPTPDPDAQTPPSVPIRVLHYLVGEDRSTLLSEHLYFLDPAPEGAIAHGLSELLLLDQGGHFLSLERSFGLTGFSNQLFQLAMGAATDTSGIVALKGDLSGIQPIYKQPLFNLEQLDIPHENLEGITLGPRLPDGSQSLILISDDNFEDTQTTQLLLLRLKMK